MTVATELKQLRKLERIRLIAQRVTATGADRVGIDSNGFRLGYGSGYFDRTLAVMAPPPLKIAVGYELSRVATIHPQAHRGRRRVSPREKSTGPPLR